MNSSRRTHPYRGVLDLPEVMEGQDYIVLLAEDSEHEVRAVRRVWEKLCFESKMRVVQDGQECLDYLRRRGKFSDPAASPRPRLLLLDLNMPKLDGFQVLSQLKSDPDLKFLPVVVLSSSNLETDVERSYDLGAAAYIVKPPHIDGLSDVIGKLHAFLEHIELPANFING